MSISHTFHFWRFGACSQRRAYDLRHRGVVHAWRLAADLCQPRQRFIETPLRKGCGFGGARDCARPQSPRRVRRVCAAGDRYQIESAVLLDCSPSRRQTSRCLRRCGERKHTAELLRCPHRLHRIRCGSQPRETREFSREHAFRSASLSTFVAHALTTCSSFRGTLRTKSSSRCLTFDRGAAGL